MSASPAQLPSGPNSVTPTTGGPPAPVVRRKPAVNIFNSKKKPPVRKAPPPAQQKPTPAGRAPNRAPAQASTNGATNAAPPADDPSAYEEYPIYIMKDPALTGGQRFHVAKLQAKIDEQTKESVLVSPFDEKDLVRPLRLHRRFARDKMEVEQSDAAGADDKERELMSARRAERQAEREENQKLIAPSGGDPAKAGKKKPSKKVEEGRDDSNPVRQKRSQLRYEEARPWHLEDFEGKNIWVGSYEQALSERSMMFRVEDGGFRVVPLEKWYKFTQTNKINAMDPEEAEKHMAKKFNVGRWAMKTQPGGVGVKSEEQVMQRRPMRMSRDEDDGPIWGDDNGDFQADRDMLDMEFNDEFQDDDEGALFQDIEGEDGKEIEARLRLEMREAGLGGTGVKDEEIDTYEEERKKQEAEQAEAKKQRRARRLLRKNEHQAQYDTDDSELDPYASEDSEDSDEERAREEEQKKEEAKKMLNGEKSGASSRGTNTPSGRPEKRTKRPGSADASEASGNESSRKRVKGANGAAIPATQGSGRSLSPDAAKSSRAAGSGSDTDTSRQARTKLKLKNSPPGSPSTGTPAGSRAGSPAPGGKPKAKKPAEPAKPFPTLEEIRVAIPAQGIEVKELLHIFRPRLGQRGKEFIALVKQAGTTDKSTGRVIPRA
ncbi:Transcription initiation factor IIF subunit alpha [Fulvia fulva]|uniref:Transcription initiation factor IIF subunit alpha n=1 Tax=Passalora fulva TaxID=5499 RepID=A0A9Q8URR1_PASFU|nr:Transcription initiation factor IIF subunit alpha [Fulvia fulva]KAK4619498.1 Transcription initiation factor IIF subunit alpha [Fulvia fulva]KAK4620696.1 Transcription initiation factor IIF subunit alpha [Fulvia fulva]UJO20003.1 Transcription initiation factor IIF subunit alpha [Fulvia fulva]WPV16983.1 Transcription initiation factor IIF subunit alpha [Fulvia fulva]WPV32402.1 Transcription initiation factor IIF subunit alpha [Fulvia fulva]